MYKRQQNAQSSEEVDPKAIRKELGIKAKLFGYSQAELEKKAAGEKVFPHVFGTDMYGRDILVRVMYGARVSMAVGICAAFLVLIIGAVYGSISGYCGGKVDAVMQRIVESVSYTHLLGEKPRPGNFPMRNRIISGMADIVIVVEAREKSGSLITAEIALEQGKDVFAVPGRITDMLSTGCNRLIQSGAFPLLQADDILDYFGIKHGKITGIQEKKQKGLAKKEKKVYICLDLQPKFIEEIVKESGLPMHECVGILLDLELEGYIVQEANHYYRKKL